MHNHNKYGARIFPYLFYAAVALLGVLNTAEAVPSTIIAEGSSLIWKVGEHSIWRFPSAHEEHVIKLKHNFNEAYHKGFRLEDIKVSKMNDQWVLCIKGQPVLVARPEHAGPIRLSAKMMSLVWLSRIYDSLGAMHADDLSAKYKLRGEYNVSGTVSWYGCSKMFGRRFANGERFEETHLTAAAKSLPFGTLVRLTATDSGKRVVVRITDRFHEHKNRILDISRAAAKILDIKNKGLAKVHVEVLGKVSRIGGK